LLINNIDYSLHNQVKKRLTIDSRFLKIR